MSPAIKISLIYVCFSVLYIVFGEWIILLFLPEISLIEVSKFQSEKGVIFVVFTGILLFLIINKYFKKLNFANEQKTEIHEINTNIFEIVNESIGIIDKGGSFVYYNKNLIEFFQLSSTVESGNIHIKQIAHNRIRTLLDSFLHDWQKEKECVFEAEEKIWIKVFLRKFELTSGIEYIFLQCEDISEKKYQEIELIESEKELLSIFEILPFGILLFDKAGKLKFFNKRSQILLEIEAIDMPTWEFSSVINTSEMEDFFNEWDKAINENIELHFKTKIYTSSKEELWFQFDAFPINRNEKRGHILIVDDISIQVLHEQKNLLDSKELKREVKKRTEEIELKNKRLEESQKALTYLLEDVNEIRDELLLSNNLLASANKELEAFSYSVSHDLRAPLRSINGFSQALLEDYGEILDNSGKDYLNRIRKGALKMGDLIDDMLVLSRISRKEMQLVDIDISIIAKEKIIELEENDPDRNVAVKIHQGIKSYGDLNLFKILFSNLLENAWKFTSHESFAEIEVGLHCDEIFVKDNGVGFDIDYKDKIFKPFQRLHSPKNYKGTGIGLTIVKRIINRHDGKIRVESKMGQGATFFMKFHEKNQN